MWCTCPLGSARLRSSFGSISILVLVALLLQHVPPVRAHCALPSVPFEQSVPENKLVSSTIMAPDFESACRAKASDYTLVIAPATSAFANACAQFQISIDQSEDCLIPVLRVARPLDYEHPDMRRCEGHLLLYAAGFRDAVSGQRLRIQVIDLNDNPPMFAQQSFAFEAAENESPPARFELPVRDRDTAPNAQFKASVENVSCNRGSRVNALNESYCRVRFEQLFRIEVHSASVAEASMSAVSSENVAVANSVPGFERSLQSAWTGGRVTLVTTGPLDYEDVSDWRVVVRVSDEKVIASINGTKRQSDAATVTINVSDRPEPPALVGCEAGDDSSRPVPVPENEAGPHVVCGLEVRDPDAGDTPECALAELDDDNRRQRAASAERPLSLPFELQPLLLGADARSPAGQPTGQGLESGPAGGARRFALRSVAGHSFDHETRARYSLRVTCNDRSGARVARDVMVLVLNANEAPVFSKPTYWAEVTESTTAAAAAEAAVGEHASQLQQQLAVALLELQATDDRLMENGEAPSIRYAIASTAGEAARAFRVEPTSGKLYRRDGYVFDRERHEWYNFSVSATDNGQPPLAASARVVVHVRDVNDNAPHFVTPRPTAKEQIEMPCTQLAGNRLYTFRADDADSVSTVITYTLVNATSVPAVQSGATSSDVRAHFRVDATSGALNVARQLQCFDLDQTISLTIRASDGELNASASLTIVVRRPTVQPADESRDFVAELKRVLSKTENMNLLILVLIVGFTLIVCVVLVAIIVCLRRRERRFGTMSSGSEGGDEADRLAEKTARIRQRMAKKGSKAAKKAKSKERCSNGKRSGCGGSSKLQTNSSVLYRSPSSELDAAAAVCEHSHLQINAHSVPECSRNSRCCEHEPECGLNTHLVCKLDAQDCLLGGAGAGVGVGVGVTPPFLAVVPQPAAGTASSVQYLPLAETHPHTCACGLYADDPHAPFPAPCFASGEQLHGPIMPCHFVQRESELAISGGAPVSGGYYPLYTYAQSGAQQQQLSPQHMSPLESDPLFPLNRLQYPFWPTRQGHYPMATFVNRSQSNSRNASRAATPNPHSHNSGNSHATLGRKGSAGASKSSPAEGPSGLCAAPGVCVPAPIEVVVTSSGCAEQEKASQGTNSSNGSGALAALGALEPFASEAAATTCATVFPLPSLAGVPTLPPLPPVPVLPGASSAVIGRRPITPRQNAESLVLLQTHSHPQAAYAAPSGRPQVAPKPAAAAGNPIPQSVQSPLPTVLDEAQNAAANGSTAGGMSKWFDRLNAASQV